MKDTRHFLSYLAHYFLEWKFSDQGCRENRNTIYVYYYYYYYYFIFYFLFFRKSCRLWYHVEKYGWEVQATYDNIAQAHCMLDN